jgi:hypothetical protein
MTEIAAAMKINAENAAIAGRRVLIGGLRLGVESMVSGKFLLVYDNLQARMRAQLFHLRLQASAHAGARSSTSL